MNQKDRWSPYMLSNSVTFYKQLRESGFLHEKSISMLFKGAASQFLSPILTLELAFGHVWSFGMLWMSQARVNQPPTIREQPSSAIPRLYHMTTKKSHAGLHTGKTEPQQNSL